MAHKVLARVRMARCKVARSLSYNLAALIFSHLSIRPSHRSHCYPRSPLLSRPPSPSFCFLSPSIPSPGRIIRDDVIFQTDKRPVYIAYIYIYFLMELDNRFSPPIHRIFSECEEYLLSPRIPRFHSLGGKSLSFGREDRKEKLSLKLVRLINDESGKRFLFSSFFFFLNNLTVDDKPGIEYFLRWNYFDLFDTIEKMLSV